MVRGRSLLSLLLGSSIPYFVEISLSSSPRMGNLTSSYRQHGHTVSKMYKQQDCHCQRGRKVWQAPLDLHLQAIQSQHGVRQALRQHNHGTSGAGT